MNRELISSGMRRVILALLSESGGFTASEHLLHSALPGFGVDCSLDSVRTELAWLEEQGLITVEVCLDTRIAKLTARGDDVQKGRAKCPGVVALRAGS